MEVKKFDDIKLYQKIVEFIKMGNKSVRLALAENKRKGLPNVIGIENKIYYQMPDGTITTKSPFKKKKKNG